MLLFETCDQRIIKKRFACVFALQKSHFICLPSEGVLDNSAEKYNKNFWRRGKEERRTTQWRSSSKFSATTSNNLLLKNVDMKNSNVATKNNLKF